MISRSQFQSVSGPASRGIAPASAPSRIDSSPCFCARTTPSFSISSALFSKHPHLIENKEKSPFFNSINFNQFRTLFHSSSGSPLFSVCSPKHTGVYPRPLSGGTARDAKCAGSAPRHEAKRSLRHTVAITVRAPHLQSSPGGATHSLICGPIRAASLISQGLTTSELRANRPPAALSAGPPNRVEWSLTNHVIPARVAGP
jgi:hypothetical protein